MKKTFLALAAGAMALTVAQAAAADSFSPTGTTVDFTGTLDLEQTQAISCDTSLEVTINGAGTSASVTDGSFSPGSFQCLFIAPDTSTPWGISVAAADGSGVATSLTVSDVAAVSLVGTCGPDDMTAAWDDDDDTLTLSGSIDGDPGACSIEGELQADEDVSIED